MLLHIPVFSMKKRIYLLEEKNQKQSEELQRWKTLANMYHDTVWQLLMKYEPELYNTMKQPDK